MKQVKPSAQTVGARIRERQKELGISNEQLADAAKVHVNTVSYWRGDHQHPTRDNLTAIAPVLQTTEEWLRGEGAGSTAVREVPVQVYNQGPLLTLPSTVHAHAHRLLAQLADDGADEHSLDWARRIFLGPQHYTYSAHGRQMMMSEDDIIRDMNALAEVARSMVHERKRLAEDAERFRDE